MVDSVTSPLPSPVTYLPVDLHRWDQGPGGDALVIPIWSDVRPLRGAAGLLDWRLCGRLSQMIREGRLSGEQGEKLLHVTGRLPWKRVLFIGIGESGSYTEGTFRTTIESALDALRGIGATSMAIALPGRDIDLVPPDRAVRDFLDLLNGREATGATWLEKLTIIDSSSTSKNGTGAPRPRSS
jgi:leucyl aminopeptidase